MSTCVLTEVDYSKPDSKVRVLGIDPGTKNLGVCVIDVDLINKEHFDLVYVSTILGEQLLYDIPIQFNDLIDTGIEARSFALGRALGELIDIYEPDIGICEDNFLGMSPLTFKQLIQFVSMAREAFNSRGIHLSYVFPNLAKDIVGANFRGSQKEDVKVGLLKYPYLNNKGIDLDKIDEHAVDAVAVCLYRCEQLAKDHGVFIGD